MPVYQMFVAFVLYISAVFLIYFPCSISGLRGFIWVKAFSEKTGLDKWRFELKKTETMKPFLGKNWMAALLLAGACCVMVACDDEDNGNGGGQTPPPADPDITAVCGDYAGTMSVVEAAPTADGDEEPAGTAIEAAVSEAEISFTDFPIRDLVVKVLGTEEGVDEIVAAIGQVDYHLPYTAEMSEDKATVAMTLAPEALKLTLPSGGESGDETADIEIEVSITAEADAVYTLESGKLLFGLAATGVKMDGEDLEAFEPFSLEFDLLQK